MYYGVLAYPEKGAGLEDGQGHQFAAALIDFAIWSRRKAYGLADIRSVFNNNKYMPPELKSFRRKLDRGFARIERRLVVLDLWQRRMLVQMSKSLGRNLTVDQSNALLPSWGEILNRDPVGWWKRASVNEIGAGSDDLDSRSKDFRRRVLKPTIPVLHMAYGLWLAEFTGEKSINRWRERYPLTALFLNPDLWIWEAVEAADNFRANALLHGDQLLPEDMVDLRRQNLPENAPVP